MTTTARATTPGQTANPGVAELAKRDAVHARFDAADAQQGSALAKAGVAKDAATVITSQGADGQRTITIPDGKGGSTTIVMDKNGVAIGGRTVMPPMRMRANGGSDSDIPPGAAGLPNNGMVALVIMVIGFPFAPPIARMIDRRGAAPRADSDTAQRLHAVENAVESIAVEVERISEGQRFTARILTQRAQQPARKALDDNVLEPVERPNG